MPGRIIELLAPSSRDVLWAWRGAGVAVNTTSAAIRAALEAAGVEFTDGDAPGVTLRKIHE